MLQLDIGPAIVSLGILGLALSLGTQQLVKDYVAGSFILIENQYTRGDIVSIGGVTGTVEDVSLRRTSLRDTDGTVHTVPHGLHRSDEQPDPQLVEHQPRHSDLVRRRRRAR